MVTNWQKHFAGLQWPKPADAKDRKRVKLTDDVRTSGEHHPGGNQVGVRECDPFPRPWAIVAGKQGEAGFDAALAVAEVLAAMSRSWESDQWETVTALEPKS